MGSLILCFACIGCDIGVGCGSSFVLTFSTLESRSRGCGRRTSDEEQGTLELEHMSKRVVVTTLFHASLLPTLRTIRDQEREFEDVE